MKKIMLTVIFCLAIFANAQTQGSAVVKFTTKTYNGAYAPRHCLAAWVTDANNSYVKSLEVKANFPNYGRYLTKWVASKGHSIYSDFSETDAVTGASINNHIAHTLTWNLKNYSGSLVADGTYKINLEFTEINGTGKYYTFSFNKNSTSSSQTPTDQTYFKSMSLVYTALSGIEEGSKNSELRFTSYPNPFNNTCTINFTLKESSPVTLEIYDTKGALVKTLIRGQVAPGTHTAVWEGIDNSGKNVASGTYYYLLKSGAKSEIKKTLLLK